MACLARTYAMIRLYYPNDIFKTYWKK